MFLHHYLDKKLPNVHMFNINTKLFVLESSFHIFAEIHQKKMLKIHVAVWHDTYF